MRTFRVYGRKYQDFYTKIEAENAHAALDAANQQDTINWFQLPSDETIEAIDVMLEENFDPEFDSDQDIQLNKDKGLI